MRLDYRVNVEDAGRRAGRLAAEKFHLSQHDLAYLKQTNGLLADGNPIRQIDRVSAGVLLSICLPDPLPSTSVPGTFRLVYEDEVMRVIDKPAGIATMVSMRAGGGSIESEYTSLYGDFRPVNRLDKGTGGLMVCATTGYYQHLLSEQLHSDCFIREYLAVVEGRMSSETGCIDLPLGHVPGSNNLRRIDPDGKPSCTFYRVLDSGNGRTLLRLRLMTGRTHQIRVHLNAIGHPICGDHLYGSPLPESPDSFALHSAYLFIRHPKTHEILFFKSTPDQRFLQLLDRSLF